MNNDFTDIRSTLELLRGEYAQGCGSDIENSNLPITERDTVAEIRSRLQELFADRDLQIHSEIKPASSQNAQLSELKKLPRVDVTVLSDRDGASWFASAKAIQDRYKKGGIEARFGSVPVEFFHTAIEVKIQSNVRDAKKDIDTLALITDQAPECNCFFVLLNARGRPKDHTAINSYAHERNITVIEYTAQAQQSYAPDQ
ncbi:MAG: hypothetical protein KAH38_10275 [Candidatus Hydrogenedentes bacterium]|nr:hypothetical protein [Candidatus Hydrogenedentota bacterium]